MDAPASPKPPESFSRRPSACLPLCRVSGHLCACVFVNLGICVSVYPCICCVLVYRCIGMCMFVYLLSPYKYPSSSVATKKSHAVHICKCPLMQRTLIGHSLTKGVPIRLITPSSQHILAIQASTTQDKNACGQLCEMATRHNCGVSDFTAIACIRTRAVPMAGLVDGK